jgi:hypothetical protein
MREYESDDETSSKESMSTGAVVTTVLANFLLVVGGVLAIVSFFLAAWDATASGAKRTEFHLAEVNKDLRKIQRKEDALHLQPPVDFQNPDAQRQRDEQFKALRKQRTDLNEKRDSLQDKQDDFEQSMLPRRPWYILGMMFGFLISMCGGICYLFVKECRLIGAIVIHAVLTAAFSFAIFGLAMTTQRF